MRRAPKPKLLFDCVLCKVLLDAIATTEEHVVYKVPLNRGGRQLPMMELLMPGQAKALLLICFSASHPLCEGMSVLESRRESASRAGLNASVIEEEGIGDMQRQPQASPGARPRLLLTSGHALRQAAVFSSLEEMISGKEIAKVVVEDADDLNFWTYLPHRQQDVVHKVLQLLKVACRSEGVQVCLSDNTLTEEAYMRLFDICVPSGVRPCLSPAVIDIPGDAPFPVFDGIQFLVEAKNAHTERNARESRSTFFGQLVINHPALSQVGDLVRMHHEKQVSRGERTAVIIFVARSEEVALLAKRLIGDGTPVDLDSAYSPGVTRPLVAEYHKMTTMRSPVNEAGEENAMRAFMAGRLQVLICVSNLPDCLEYCASMVVEFNVPRSVQLIARHADHVRRGGEYVVLYDEKDCVARSKNMGNASLTVTMGRAIENVLEKQRFAQARIIAETRVGCILTAIGCLMGMGMDRGRQTCSADALCSSCAARAKATTLGTRHIDWEPDPSYAAAVLRLVRSRKFIAVDVKPHKKKNIEKKTKQNTVHYVQGSCASVRTTVEPEMLTCAIYVYIY